MTLAQHLNLLLFSSRVGLSVFKNGAERYADKKYTEADLRGINCGEFYRIVIFSRKMTQLHTFRSLHHNQFVLLVFSILNLLRPETTVSSFFDQKILKQYHKKYINLSLKVKASTIDTIF